MTRTWVRGECWVCEAADVFVLWLGPVQTVEGAGPCMACESCVRRLEARVRAYLARRSGAH